MTDFQFQSIPPQHPQEFGYWGEWGDCSCSCNGIRDRTRRISQYAMNGGKPCDGATKQVEGCNTGAACGGESPVDCVLSEWVDWGECSAECGGGVHRRQREVQVYPRNGGKSCEGKFPVTSIF